MRSGMTRLLLSLSLVAACGGSSTPEATITAPDAATSTPLPPIPSPPPAGSPADAGVESDGGVDSAPTPSPVAITFLDSAGREITEQIVFEAAEVRVSGAAPGAKLTLSARLRGDTYESSATFLVRADGTVSTRQQAPEAGGSYSGVDVDGLFWSMAPTDPALTGFSSTDIAVRAELDGKSVSLAWLTRPFAAAGVRSRHVSDNGLVGVFHTPASPGPHPAILAFGGSEGGLQGGDTMASFLASMGYAALGVAYFGSPGLPKDLQGVPLEYLGKALAWLAAQPEVVPSKLGVMGGSRGGELALLLGAVYPEVHAVVAQAPSALAWGDAWTYQGKTIPGIMRYGTPQTAVDAQGRTVYLETPAFEQALAESTAAEIDAATTRVEKTRGPILMIAGAADSLWPSCRFAKVAMDRLDAAGHTATYGDEMHCYPGAGHWVTPYGAGLPTNVPQEFSADGLLYSVGGDGPGLGHGDRDSYARLQAFLARALK